MNKGRVARKRGLIFVISGPSGSGKTTLIQHLLEDAQLKNKLVKSISFTTRPKRPDERQGKDYFFITKKEFRRRLKAKQILEWTRYLDDYYGTPKDFIDKQLRRGRHVVLCLDLNGARSIKRFYPQNTRTIFVLPPSIGTLEARIKKRCCQTAKQELRRRLVRARQEILAAGKYDYCVRNERLARAARELKGIITHETAI